MILNTDIIDRIIRETLHEDIGTGDVTTELLFDKGVVVEAAIIAGEPFVVAGIPVVERVFSILGGDTGTEALSNEGDSVDEGDVICRIKGDVRVILSGERVALNFLQRLSGIATLTREFVDRVKGLPVRILHTRKTTPLLRYLERYAVGIGGAGFHRSGLFDGILIKDNHIRACGGVGEAVKRARDRAPVGLKIEVEVGTLEELDEALTSSPDIILLDNMDIDTLKKAVSMAKGRALLEASGGVRLENIRSIAETGVDFISIGAITHSARAMDISMELL